MLENAEHLFCRPSLLTRMSIAFIVLCRGLMHSKFETELAQQQKQSNTKWGAGTKAHECERRPICKEVLERTS